jgi:GDP-mannose transporter
MTLLNKAALSAFHFTAPTSLLCFQCTLTLLLVGLSYLLGFGRPPALNWRLLRLWLPVNVLFVGMVWSSFYALRGIGVAMVTVLKNLTNFLVIFGDLHFFGKRYSTGVWATLFLMLASALAAAATDLAFDGPSYTWQMANNFFTAAYSLWLRGVIIQMSVITHKQGGTDELGMVVYNNLLSIPMILALVFATGEAGRLWKEPALRQHSFQAAAVVSALLSFLISIASMWFLSCTTATMFSLVGSLNKIPLAILGMLLFKAPTSTNNVISVLIGLAAGVVFAHAKATSSVQGSSSGGKDSTGSRGLFKSRSGDLPRYFSAPGASSVNLLPAGEEQQLQQ